MFWYFFILGVINEEYNYLQKFNTDHKRIWAHSTFVTYDLYARKINQQNK